MSALWGLGETSDAHVCRDPRDSRDPRDLRELRDSRECRDPRDPGTPEAPVIPGTRGPRNPALQPLAARCRFRLLVLQAGQFGISLGL